MTSNKSDAMLAFEEEWSDFVLHLIKGSKFIENRQVNKIYVTPEARRRWEVSLNNSLNFKVRVPLWHILNRMRAMFELGMKVGQSKCVVSSATSASTTNESTNSSEKDLLIPNLEEEMRPASLPSMDEGSLF